MMRLTNIRTVVCSNLARDKFFLQISILSFLLRNYSFMVFMQFDLHFVASTAYSTYPCACSLSWIGSVLVNSPWPCWGGVWGWGSHPWDGAAPPQTSLWQGQGELRSWIGSVLVNSPWPCWGGVWGWGSPSPDTTLAGPG